MFSTLALIESAVFFLIGSVMEFTTSITMRKARQVLLRKETTADDVKTTQRRALKYLLLGATTFGESIAISFLIM